LFRTIKNLIKVLISIPLYSFGFMLIFCAELQDYKEYMRGRGKSEGGRGT